MSPSIIINEIEKTSDVATFEVVVKDEEGSTVHTVHVDDEYLATLGVDVESDAAIRELVRRSFLFLLRREPKEAILREFDLHAIERYFPEYRGRITSLDT